MSSEAELQSPSPSPPQGLSLQEKRRRFERYVRQWFGDVDLSQIRRGNMLQFLSSVYLLRPEEREEVEQSISRIEKEVEMEFAPGLDTTTRCFRVSLDSFDPIHRPLFVYAWLGLVNLGVRPLLRLAGFQHKNIGGFRYWVKQSTRRTFQQSPYEHKNMTSSDGLTPLVFMHGLGHGLSFYCHFLVYLALAWGDKRTVILCEFPYVSLRLAERILPVEESVAAIETALAEEGYSQAIFAGHSFGTYCVTWCIKYRPWIVKSAMLLDPVRSISP